MPSSALNTENKVVCASKVEIRPGEDRPLYSCPECGNRMVFVECEKKVNHFRHYKFSNCEFETEPETSEHYYAKKVVDRIFRHFAENSNYKIIHGKEKPIADAGTRVTKYPDIYIEVPELERKVAVEVQYSNYDIKTFREKILFYAFRNITVIYLFFGDNFQNTLKTNQHIYLLKDIEKEIFYKNNLPVYAGYLIYKKDNVPYVELPNFSRKFKKGNYDYAIDFPSDLFVDIACCQNRFIKKFNPPIVRLRDWLFEHIFEKYPRVAKDNLCKHNKTSFVFSDGKIKRHKEVCTICKKFIRWLPKSESKALDITK